MLIKPRRRTLSTATIVSLIVILLLTMFSSILPASVAQADTVIGPERVPATGEPVAPTYITYENGVVKFPLSVSGIGANLQNVDYYITINKPTGLPEVHRVYNLGLGGVIQAPGGSTRSSVCSPWASTPYCEIDMGTVLSANGTYSASVYAKNTIGNSIEVFSTPVVVSPPTLTPANVEVTSTSGTNALVKFDKVANEPGKSAINKYTLVIHTPKGIPLLYEVANLSTTPTLVQSTAPGTPLTPAPSCTATYCTVSLPALSVEGAYSVEIYASNSTGNGPSSEPVSINTTLHVPTVQANNYILTQSGTNLVVNFDIPSVDLSTTPINKYYLNVRQPTGNDALYEIRSPLPGLGSVFATAGGGSAIANNVCSGTSTVHCTVTILGLFTVSGTYSVGVAAVNSVGIGESLYRDYLYLPPASAPTNFEVVFNGTSFVAGFSPIPAASESNPITKYVLSIQPPAGLPYTQEILPTACTGTPVRCSVSLGGSLRSGQYYISVYAQNAAGNGPIAEALEIKYGTNTPVSGAQPPPTPVITGFTSAANGSLNLSFTHASSGSGPATSSYIAILYTPNTKPTVMEIYRDAGTGNWMRKENGGTGVPYGLSCSSNGCGTVPIGGMDYKGLYSVEVIAVNSAGNSAATSLSTIENTIPAKPALSSASFSGQTLTVNFTKPTSLTNVTGYRLTINRPNTSVLPLYIYYNGSGWFKKHMVTDYTESIANPCPTSSCSITATSVGVYVGAYDIEIAAVNAAGNSEASDPISANATATGGVTTAPCTGTTVHYTPEIIDPNDSVSNNHTYIANNILYVEWEHPGTATYTSPTNVVTHPTVAYTVVLKPANGTPILKTVSGSASVTTYTTSFDLASSAIKLLGTPGEYSVQVYASNCGNSLMSNEVAKTLELPVAPTSPVSSVVGGQLKVDWTPTPVGASNTVVGGYFITVTPPEGATQTFDVAGYATSTFTMPGQLPVAGEYHISIGSYSLVAHANSSTFVTDDATIGKPSVPTYAATEVLGNKLVTTWRLPEENGGSAILGYKATVLSPGGTIPSVRNITPLAVVSPLIAGETATVNGSMYSWSLPITVRGLYQIELLAYTVTGNSIPVKLSAANGIAPPDPITGLNVNVANGQADVTWNAPVNQGGGVLQGFRIVVNPQTSNPVVKTVLVDGTGTSIGGNDMGSSLTNGLYAWSYKVPYSGEVTIRIYAYNPAGNSTPVTGGDESTIPYPPVDPHISISGGKVRVSWNPPETEGSHPVAGYNLALYQPAGAPVLRALGTTATTTDPNLNDGLTLITVDGKPTYTWSYTVTASGGYRAELSSRTVTAEQSITVSDVTSPDALSVPGKVSGLTVSYGSGKFTANWVAPTMTGGAPVTSYIVTWRGPSVFSSASVANTTSEYITTVPGTYTVTVSAVNAVGKSLWQGKNITLDGSGNGTTSSATVDAVAITTGGVEIGGVSPVAFTFQIGGTGTTSLGLWNITLPTGLKFESIGDSTEINCEITNGGNGAHCYSLNGITGPVDSTVHSEISALETESFGNVKIIKLDGEALGGILVRRSDVHYLPYGSGIIGDSLEMSTADCRSLMVIGARGSSQLSTNHNGLGDQVYNFTEMLNNTAGQYSSVGAVAVSYQATDVPPNTSVPNFLLSLDSATTGLEMTLATIIAKCSDSKIILSGFSQGAWAVQHFITNMSSTLWNHVDSVVLISSPGLTGGDGIPHKFAPQGVEETSPDFITTGIGEIIGVRLTQLLRAVAADTPLPTDIPSGILSLLTGPDSVITPALATTILANLDPDNSPFLQQQTWEAPSNQHKVFQICDLNDAVCSFDDFTNWITVLVDAGDGTTMNNQLNWSYAWGQWSLYLIDDSVHMGPAYLSELNPDIIYAIVQEMESS